MAGPGKRGPDALPAPDPEEGSRQLEAMIGEQAMLTAEGKLRGSETRFQEETRKKRAQALELRKAGATYEQIAKQLGYESRSGAHYAVQSALKEITDEPAQSVRDMELQRLDTALLAIWTEVRKGSLPHIDRMVRLMDMRAKLLGLYSPIKIAPTDPTGAMEYTGKSDSELVEQFERLVDAIRGRRNRIIDGRASPPGAIAPAAEEEA